MGYCVLVTCMQLFSQQNKRCLLDLVQSTMCFCLASLCYILSSCADKVDLQLNCFHSISFGYLCVSVLQNPVSSL